MREIAGYPESRSASRRAFERDKETLRAMGVPVLVEQLPFGDGNDVGYRVDPDEYYLADLDLTEEETTALNVAVNAVALESNAGLGALMKLGGRSVQPSAAPIASLPWVPALPALFDAFRRRAVASFDYRDERRSVEAWALSSRSGRWYLIGLDHDREAVRTFRADRVQGEVSVGESDAFAVPSGFDDSEYIRAEPWKWGGSERIDVDLLVDTSHADALLALAPEAELIDERADGRVFRLTVTEPTAFRTLALGFLEHAEVLAPPRVRELVVNWLEDLAS